MPCFDASHRFFVVVRGGEASKRNSALYAWKTLNTNEDENVSQRAFIENVFGVGQIEKLYAQL